MTRKRRRSNVTGAVANEGEEEDVPLTRYEEDSDEEESSDEEGRDGKKAKTEKASKWVNKQRVLVFGSRGIGPRDRHLMEDIRSLMPHARADSKMQRKESLFVINEVAEMKNCNKCLFFEGRRNRKDLYLWASNIARGPSVKFQVENVHTMGELKLTGNCLKASRPILSFDEIFQTGGPYLEVIKELLTQIFSVPNHHPRSQPFFDHVYTFSVVDNKIWFRNFQIVEEDGSLAEIGPRFVLNPIKVFESSFSGQTLWENGDYVTPTAHRAMLKKMKAGKYLRSVQAKAAYKASRPKVPTVEVDKTDDVFQTIVDEEEEQRRKEAMNKKLPLKMTKHKRKKMRMEAAAKAAAERV